MFEATKRKDYYQELLIVIIIITSWYYHFHRQIHPFRIMKARTNGFVDEHPCLSHSS